MHRTGKKARPLACRTNAASVFAFRLFSFVITDAGTQLRKYLAGTDVRARASAGERERAARCNGTAEYFCLTIAHLFTRISVNFRTRDSRRGKRGFYSTACLTIFAPTGIAPRAHQRNSPFFFLFHHISNPRSVRISIRRMNDCCVLPLL